MSQAEAVGRSLRAVERPQEEQTFMAIEIDATLRLARQRDALATVTRALADTGARPWWTGAAALLVLRDLELPAAWPIRCWIAGDLAAASELVARLRATDPGIAALPAVEFQALPDGAPEASADRAQAGLGKRALQRLAKAQVRPWAIAVDADGEVADPTGFLLEPESAELTGAQDLAHWLRGRADRLLELAALAAATGLRPGEAVVRVMLRDGSHVLGLDRQLWCRWMEAILTAPRPSVGLQLLQDVRVLPLLVPEASAMVDFHKSCPVHHKDIWDHTLQVVDKCPPHPVVRWAALMHDVGKVWTRSLGTKGKVHFFRHEELGASLMEGVAGRFRMDPGLRDEVCYVIGNHARANVYSTEWTDSAVRRLIRDMGPHLDAVLAFSRSDFTTKRAWRIREVRELGEELIRRIEEIRAADARVPPLPKGFGTLVIERTGRKPGPWLGEIQRVLEAEVDAGRLEGQLGAEAYWAWLQEHGQALLTADDAAGRAGRQPAAARTATVTVGAEPANPG